MKEKMPEVYAVLTQGGESAIVKFQVAFTEIDYYQKASIAYQFICNIAAQYFWKYNYPVCFDAITYSDVTPDRIIEVIPHINKYLNDCTTEPML